MKRILASNNKKSPTNINEIELDVQVDNKNKKNLGSEGVPDVDGYNEMDKNKGAAKDLVRKGLNKIKNAHEYKDEKLKMDGKGRFKGDVANGVPFEKPKEGEKGWVGKGIDRIKKAHKKKPYQDRIMEEIKKPVDIDPFVIGKKESDRQKKEREEQKKLKNMKKKD